MNDWIELRPDALGIDAAIEFVTDPAGGGIATFLGTTRAERNATGASLVALEYEAAEDPWTGVPKYLEQIRKAMAAA